MYFITDGDNNYVKLNDKGEVEIVSSRSRAGEFTETKAKNLIKNNLKTHVVYKRKAWVLNEVSEVIIKAKEMVFPYESIDPDKFRESVSYLQKVLSLSSSNYTQLMERLSTVDREQNDLLHYIEDTKLNAAQWCHIGKQIQEVRIRRRSIKNQLRFNQLASQLNKDTILSGDIVRNIESVQLGAYTPRVLTELFNEGGEEIND